MTRLSRRRFLAASAATGAASFVPAARAASHAAPAEITIGTRVIEVRGKAAKVFGLLQPDGTHGLVMNAGERFRVRLRNEVREDALIHWHGLTPPNDQDGVPGVTQPPLAPGASYDYDFAVALPGTNWMHSHHVLQEQSLMAAPLIVRDPKDAALDEQEVVILLHDFTFEVPQEILDRLAKGMSHGDDAMAATAPQADHDMSQMPGMNMSDGDMSQMSMAGMDLNDVSYDAFLANDRTLDDPDVVRVDKGQRVRLRIINAAASTNFMIELGGLSGSLTDVDGRPIVPVMGSRFPIAIAQRADVRFTLPAQEGAWPILFQREGDTAVTGIVLATKNGAVAKLADQAQRAIGAIVREVPMLYEAAEPLPERRADRELAVDLTGSMMTYRWGIGETAAAPPAYLMVSEGERVEMTLTNRTEMSHPMHLHGHHFQVVAVNGARVKGAVRDTELVPIGGSVTLAFDAVNPGKWMFHCHNLYHMLSGMMTQVRYQ